jgi:malate dehydrogenase
MVESILKNENRIYPCCAMLNGEYNLNGVFVGVPVKLGAQGIEELIELKLNDAEMALLNDSADQVRQVMDVYDGLTK